MFTKQEYIQYFNEIMDIERKMLTHVHELKKMLPDADIQEMLQEILLDEHDHIQIENAIIKALTS